MGRGTSGPALATVIEQDEIYGAPSDHELVARVRHGDDRAFEALYGRYHRRIGAFVQSMVKDHGRAEDVTQEVFVSALRRMRATERPIAFKPWIYEIAKNACIDAFRRSRRTEEISIDADGALPAGDQCLADPDVAPDAAVAAKQDLETLCGAFGGLSPTHHKILVMRELEGRSYSEIGARLGMTRPAVESTLFRARRRLSEEYEQLVSGQRCLQVQAIIATAADGAVGTRDARKLARHLSHCQPCRRVAIEAGLDRGLVVRRPARERIPRKVAAWLPLPAFLRGRRGTGGDGGAESGASSFVVHLPALSDQLSGGWGKLIAAAAVLLAGASAGVIAHSGPASADKGLTQVAPASAGPGHAAPPSTTTAADLQPRPHAVAPAPAAQRPAAHARKGHSRAHARNSGGRGAGAKAGAAHRSRGGGGAGGGGAGTGGSGGTSGTGAAPSGGSNPVTSIQQAAGGAVQQAASVVQQAAGGVVQQAAGAVQQAAGAVQQAAGAVQQAAGTVQQAAGTVAAQTGGALSQTTGALP